MAPDEASRRLQDLLTEFALTIRSPRFTPQFLNLYLRTYRQHADHILHNYSKQGNHLLFEAQRMLFAGIYFPEFREAAEWRRSGIEILNREIGVQVYPDGMQFELDFGYHIAAIDIFLKALGMGPRQRVRKRVPRELHRDRRKDDRRDVEHALPRLYEPNVRRHEEPRQGDPATAVPQLEPGVPRRPTTAMVRHGRPQGRPPGLHLAAVPGLGILHPAHGVGQGRHGHGREGRSPGRSGTTSPTTARSTTGAGAATSSPTRAATSTAATAPCWPSATGSARPACTTP